MGETAGSHSTPERAFELIQFPVEAIIASRVFQQRAGLIFPDLILSRIYATLSKAPPPGKAVKDGLNAVEDISKRDGVERFPFRHSQHSKFHIRSYAARLFPRADGFHALLTAFLNGLMPRGIFLTDRGVCTLP
jgi:hypothetical protein